MSPDIERHPPPSDANDQKANERVTLVDDVEFNGLSSHAVDRMLHGRPDSGPKNDARGEDELEWVHMRLEGRSLGRIAPVAPRPPSYPRAMSRRMR